MHRQPTKNLSNVISPYYYITVIWDALGNVSIVLFRVAICNDPGTLQVWFQLVIEPMNQDQSALNSEQNDSALTSASLHPSLCVLYLYRNAMYIYLLPSSTCNKLAFNYTTVMRPHIICMCIFALAILCDSVWSSMISHNNPQWLALIYDAPLIIHNDLQHPVMTRSQFAINGDDLQ